MHPGCPWCKVYLQGFLCSHPQHHIYIYIYIYIYVVVSQIRGTPIPQNTLLWGPPKGTPNFGKQPYIYIYTHTHTHFFNGYRLKGVPNFRKLPVEGRMSNVPELALLITVFLQA